MIPRSITLRGFLCYKDEQVVDLDGCDLWVLAGRNGSGKSAVFDAMTFALFKAHRGGKQEAANLIHAEADSLSVCFEFDLGTSRYRIGRNVPRRGQTERWVSRLEIQPDGTERWPRVPETQAEKGLERWVRDHIGLTYETFTASVLLLQGRSESLLGAKPTARFEIVAGIVDLESYRDLHKRADQKRKRLDERVNELQSQLQTTAVVESEAIEQAEGQLAEAEEDRVAAEAEWARLVNLAAQAGTWLDLVGRRRKALEACEHARRLIADSEVIALACQRLRSLEALLPEARRAIGRRESLSQHKAQARDAEERRRDLSRKLDLIAALFQYTRGHLGEIVEEIRRDEARQRSIQERLAALAIPMHRASQARARREEVRRHEAALVAFPADLGARVADLEAAQAVRSGWKAALPSLAVLARERASLAAARERRHAAERAIEVSGTEERRSEAALAERRAEESAARQAEARARDRATEAATLARAAEERLARLEGLDGSTSCDRCGQDLTAEHLAAETAHRREEFARAAEAAEVADRDLHEAGRRLAAAEAILDEAERFRREAEKAAEEARREAEKAAEDSERHALACRDAFDRLDEPFRSRVAAEPPGDWLATTFPEAGDLDEGRRLAGEVREFQSRLDAERARLEAMESERARLEQARFLLAAVGQEPGDDEAEAEHVARQAEHRALESCLKGHATQRLLAEETLAGLDEHAESLKEGLAEAETTRTVALARVEALADEMGRARAAAPEAWRDALDAATEDDIAAWDDERRSLRDRGVEEQAEELPRAHLRLENAEADLEEVDRRIGELPEEARLDPRAIAPRIARADEARKQAGEVRQGRQAALNALRGAREQRLGLQERALAAERDLAVVARLAELLGPRGLQRDLIRDAERGIVGLANPLLRDISGGELDLELLEPGEDQPDHALQLEAVVRTHGSPRRIDVAYLSGSQKFRVAVSLALAIGQYARGSKERPIESVIIDEGFGSLDRHGRDEMIEQLNALRGRLARIILVSHQEEFAEAFRDGYRFEVVEGSTLARPFHR
jgi:exonuclease SbcC